MNTALRASFRRTADKVPFVVRPAVHYRVAHAAQYSLVRRPRFGTGYADNSTHKLLENSYTRELIVPRVNKPGAPCIAAGLKEELPNAI